MCKCVIVVWSKESVLSNWVKVEAEVGKRRGTLIPILIDDVEIPIVFGRIQTASLIDWKGTLPHPGFGQLLGAIATILDHSPNVVRKQEHWERESQERVGEEKTEKETRKEEHPAIRRENIEVAAKEKIPANVHTRKWTKIAVTARIIAVIIATVVLYRKSPANISVPPPQILKFVALPSSIQRGESSTLSWATKNTEKVKISHIGNVEFSGLETVSPTETTTYTLSATNESNKTDEREVTIEVTVPSPAKPASTRQIQPQSKRINLLATENGGHLVVASSDDWIATIDEKNKDGSQLNYGIDQEAVYAFKDERPAMFDTFTMHIPGTNSNNINEFELLVADDSATEVFRSIGKFHTQNLKLFKTPYQEFKFSPLKAKYLKFRLISTFGWPHPWFYGFQLFGSLDQ